MSVSCSQPLIARSWAWGVPFLLLAACSTPAEPVPAVKASASYTLDGRVTAATGSASLQLGLPGGSDLLTIRLEGPAAGKGKEVVEASFTKPAGSPDTGYQPLSLLVDGSSGVVYYRTQLVMTIAKMAKGRYSGTFAGQQSYTAPNTPVSVLSNGSFTEVP